MPVRFCGRIIHFILEENDGHYLSFLNTITILTFYIIEYGLPLYHKTIPVGSVAILGPK